ncbi:hypothetical protein GTP44_00965 [Duganella sp. FT50W]|uniref:Uncharacterized protein n=1 Tax=Duganella lactea TaxID=2692173 RepID=A0A6L8MCZ4_9BURK|nr:hypothetical protein [Duganella lactea]MYM80530.1 hypothetical protein [Duganella lactea]
MRAFVVENGVVINTIEVDSLDIVPGLIEATVGGVGWHWDGKNLMPPVEVLPTVADYDAALTGMFEAKARERRYDGRISCALRAGYAGPFQAEGAAFASWMDECNALAYRIMAEVLSNTRPQPSVPELLALMPVLVWPE